MPDKDSYSRSILEVAHEPFLVLDQGLRVRVVNPAFCKTFSVEPEETEGRYVYELGNGQWDIPALRSLLEKVLPENRSFEQFEVSHTFPEIGHRVILVNGRHIGEQEGLPTMILLGFLDVTKGRQSEKRLTRQVLIAKLLFRATALATETDSVEDALEHCVDAVCELTGWPVGHVFIVPDDPREALISTNIWRLGEEAAYSELRKKTDSIAFDRGIGLVGSIWQTQQLAWLENLEEEPDFLRDEVCRKLGLRSAFGFPIRVGGETKAILEFFNTTPASPSADILSFCGSIAEPVGRVIERKLITEKLERAKQEADKANQAKSQFLANVSHELRTPMNAILGMLQLALEDDLSKTLHDYLETAKDSADALLVLLNDVLDISKLEAGEFKIEKEPFRMRDLVADILKPLSTTAFQKGLELACEIDEDVPEHLVGAPHRLRQILTNVVGNAIKFTEEGEVVVTVERSPGDDENVHLKFTISDTGIGISEEDQEKIFAPFTQADSSTTRNYGGTGLGLAIVREIVSAMDGTISLESNPGTGSRFEIELPYRKDQKPAPGRLAPRFSRDTLRGMPVLVVDDNKTNRRILKQMLSNWEMSPEPAASGEEALEKLEATDAGSRYPLILLDALMPDMDGYTVARKIMENSRMKAPVILMLSSSDRSVFADRNEGLELAAYLQKPVSQSDLLDAILTALDMQEDNASETGPSDTSKPSHCSIEVLLAEDTPANQKVVLSILKKRGHHITIAENGREAVELIKEQTFDVVLMDVQMPIMDGYQATAAIRAQETATGVHLPIIAMTAHAMKGDRERCLEAGMDDYLAKPIEVAKLVELVEKSAGSSSYDKPDQLKQPSSKDQSKKAPPAVDLEGAMSRLDGDMGLFREFIGYFEKDVPDLMEALHIAIHDQQASEVQRAAHSIKGLAANFGAEGVTACATQLENMGKSDDLAEAKQAFGKLQREMDRLRRELSKYEKSEEKS